MRSETPCLPFAQDKVLDASVYKWKPPHEAAPDPKDFDVLFFPPGICDAGRITGRLGTGTGIGR